MRSLRHPSAIALGAWFDGEGASAVGAHTARCERCQRRVSEMARVRAWVRAQPFVCMGDERPVTVAEAGRNWRTVVLALALLLVLVAKPGRTTSADRLAADRPDGAPGAAAPHPGARPADGGWPGGGTAAGDSASGQVAGAGPAGADRKDAGAPRADRLRNPITLGLVVPTMGGLAAEGREVEQVVRQRVTAANASGGIGGLPVQLVVIPAEDRAAVAAATSRVDALVGGFGAAAPGNVPWVLPADPTVSAPGVLEAEASPWTAGAQLATFLRRLGLERRIGVVVGSGPDAAFAAGLSARSATSTVLARDGTTCDSEIAALQREAVAALAIAGDASLTSRCLRAVHRAGWVPVHGVVVPPSAAYADLAALAEPLATRTVLALPWPTSDDAGAARFRAAAPAGASYRALVSFAAVELAIDLGRQHGALTLDVVRSARWRSDLVAVAAPELRTGTVVLATGGAWAPVLALPLRTSVATPL